jgi:hypothetical protein
MKLSQVGLVAGAAMMLASSAVFAQNNMTARSADVQGSPNANGAMARNRMDRQAEPHPMAPTDPSARGRSDKQN